MQNTNLGVGETNILLGKKRGPYQVVRRNKQENRRFCFIQLESERIQNTKIGSMKGKLLLSPAVGLCPARPTVGE